MVGKAWDKLMVRQVNYAAKIYVKKRHVSSAAHHSAFSLIKWCYIFFKYRNALEFFFNFLSF